MSNTNEFTLEHRDHMLSILQSFKTMLLSKYPAGVVEHGGHLTHMSQLELCDNALFETVDQFTYLITLREKIINDETINQKI